MSEYNCPDCYDTGFYGNNGPGIKGNSEYQRCDNCNVEPPDRYLAQDFSIENEQLRAENERLKAELVWVKAVNKALDESNVSLLYRLRDTLAENERLKSRVEKAERWLVEMCEAVLYNYGHRRENLNNHVDVGCRHCGCGMNGYGEDHSASCAVLKARAILKEVGDE
jgi:hypothetical protein